MANESNPQNEPEEKQSIFGVIVHSFFVIPFLIAVFCVLLFTGVRMLTMEKHTIYDHLEDIKTGSLNKRWQAAFELSKILADPDKIPTEARFQNEMITAFKHARHDDNRIRQYLALAMGRTGDAAYKETLVQGLEGESEENLHAVIYAIGMLQDSSAALKLHPYLKNPDAKIRLATVMALGNIQNRRSIRPLKSALQDSEPNVAWDAAIALAKLKDDSGKGILLNLLDRKFLSQYPEVDHQEQNHILQVVIEAAAKLNNSDINQAILKLSESDPNMNVRKMALATLE